MATFYSIPAVIAVERPMPEITTFDANNPFPNYKQMEERVFVQCERCSGEGNISCGELFSMKCETCNGTGRRRLTDSEIDQLKRSLENPSV